MLPVSQTIATRAASFTLTPEERTRYSRHILLPEVGLEGQRKLKAARILVIGAGGLGAPVSFYLAAAGVGTLGLVEFDNVDVTNLQRQILYTTVDVGRPKLTAATERLRALSPGLAIEGFPEALTPDNAGRIIDSFDIIVDGTDNFMTRYLVNDTCVRLEKPNVYGSIFRFEGQASVFYAPYGPCYRCLFPAPPPPDTVPNCAEGGVLGVLPGQIGMIQATEAIKLVLGLGTSLLGRLVMFDALSMRFDQYTMDRDANCPACGDHRDARALALPTMAACEISPREPESDARADELISTDDYKALLDRSGPHVLLDVRSAGEVAVAALPGHHHIPLDALLVRISELDRNSLLIVYCKSGARSLRAVRQLRELGFVDTRSLQGGILAWIDRFAPELPRY